MLPHNVDKWEKNIRYKLSVLIAPRISKSNMQKNQSPHNRRNVKAAHSGKLCGCYESVQREFITRFRSLNTFKYPLVMVNIKLYHLE